MNKFEDILDIEDRLPVKKEATKAISFILLIGISILTFVGILIVAEFFPPIIVIPAYLIQAILINSSNPYKNKLIIFFINCLNPIFALPAFYSLKGIFNTLIGKPTLIECSMIKQATIFNERTGLYTKFWDDDCEFNGIYFYTADVNNYLSLSFQEYSFSWIITLGLILTLSLLFFLSKINL